MLGVEVADTARFGALHLNADGRLAGFQEKGVTGAGHIDTAEVAERIAHFLTRKGKGPQT